MRFAKPHDPPGATAAAVTSALLIAQQVAGKAARDALFLTSFQASRLPLAMAGSAVLSLAAVHGVSRLMVRRPPATVMPLLLCASAVGFALQWLIAFSSPRLSAALVYGQTAVLGPVMLSAFWSLVNERFDPHTAKHAVSRIAGGGTLGGVLGGLMVWRASTLIDPHTVLLLLALINGAGVVGVLVTRARGTVAASSVAEEPSQLTDVSAIGELKEAPFLRNLALLVALGAAISAILDYIFSVQAVAAFGKGPALLSFFSLFWLGVGVLSFVLQAALGRVALEKLGLAVNIAVLPGLIILGSAFGLAMPGLASSSLLRGAEAVQRNTLFRSAYELLYTPLSEKRKRATKVLIDVGFDRLGTVLGSGLALLALWGLSRHTDALLLGTVVVLAFATLFLARRLHVGYVEALQQGLREAANKLETATVEEAQRVTAPPGRETLIQRIEELQPGGLTALLESGVEPNGPPAAATPALEALQSNDRVLSKARQLVSPNTEQARRALEQLDARGPEVACAILLLAHDELHQAARQALGKIAPSITGQLIDALLDPEMDYVVRRRLPRVLRKCPTQRAAEGLLLGIADARFEVRYECGRALLALTHDNAQIVISQQKALEAIQREVEGGKRILESLEAQFDDDDDASAEESRSSLVDGLVLDRVNRSLEHVFTILCLHLEREPLRLAFRALHHEDTQYRGTALEYLDTILPSEVRELIWPLLGEVAPLPSARPAKELLADLTLAAQAR